jgi:hypothetical protein
MGEEINKLYDKYSEYYLKFVYYLLGIDVVCFGFIFKVNSNISVEWKNSFLLLSIICLGISFWCGIKNRKNELGVIYKNFQYLKLKQSLQIENSEELKEIFIKLEKEAKENSFSFHAQYLTLFLGFIFYFLNICDFSKIIYFFSPK